MKYFFLALLVVFAFNCKQEISCDTYKKENYIPINLDDSFKFLNCNLEEVEISKFKKEDESIAVSGIHFSTGLYIRNNWGLLSGESQLFDFFNKLGVSHPDDISGIILTSYHRYLNGKDTQFDKMVSETKKYYEQVKIDELAATNKKFENIAIHDTVKFDYPYGFLSTNRNNNFEDQSCFALGIVTNKESTKLRLKVKLIENCDEKGIIISKKYYDFKDSIDLIEIINNPKIILKINEEYWSNLENWNEY